MNTLFISTYNKYINIALIQDDKLLEHKKISTINAHSEHTLPMIKEILTNHNITPQNLNQIEVVNGPGSFTGVRIGVTIAKTLAYTLNIPIKTISSLHACALSTQAIKKIVTIPDIKGVYYGLFNEKDELIEPLNYLSNKDFKNFINDYNYQNILIEGIENLDIKNIHEYLKNIKPTNPHHVNPLYIKKIEVEV